MSGITCRAVAPFVTAMGAGDDVSFSLASRHISRCLHCQAQLARTRRMRRDLRSLAEREAMAPRHPIDFVGSGHARRRDRRPLVVLGAVAVLAVGALRFRRLSTG